MKKLWAIFLTMILMLTGCGKPVAEKNGPTEAQLAAIRETAEGIVLQVADMYGVPDMRFVKTEEKGFHQVCVFESVTFGKLESEMQLALLADVSLVTYKEKPFPEESGIAGKGFELQVESGGERYEQYTFSGESCLRRGGKDVFSMKTTYSALVEGNLKTNMDKIDAIIESGENVENSMPVPPNSCRSCKTSYREGTAGAQIIAKTGYCSDKCRRRIEGE